MTGQPRDTGIAARALAMQRHVVGIAARFAQGHSRQENR